MYIWTAASFKLVYEMKALTVLSFLGMLIVALCESNGVDLEDAGPMPPESGEQYPPGIMNEKRSGKDMGSQDMDRRIRTLVKTILAQRRLEQSKRDSDEEEEKIVSEKRGNRRNLRRGNKERKEQNQQLAERMALAQPQVTSMEAAETLDMKGEETETRVPPNEQEDTVYVHQQFRSSEHGNNIWKIHWDDSLARLGQALADKCVFKHTNLHFANDTRVGQNLAIIKGSNHSIEKVVQLFYNEKINYDIVDNSYVDYNIVGHYLQLVFWDTEKVGCGVNYCPTLYLPETDTVWNNAWFWACDYWPPLHANTRPYQVGDPCSECVVPPGKEIGWKCEDNTCEDCKVGEPGCNEPKPCTKYDQDTKKEAICSKVKKYGYCERKSVGYKFAKLYCRTTCQFCRGIPESMDTRK